MLIATPGQATTYSLLGNGAPKKACISSTATPKSTTSASLVATNNCSINKSSNSAASTLMKTISVRLNRGTEFLKDTVQKALINNTTSSKNVTTTTSNISFRNSNINNFNTAPIASLKHNKATVAVAASGPSSNILANKAHSTALAASAPYTFARTSIAASSSSKPFKVNTVPPTNIHRYPQERNETKSTDSINKELCHFKPIISAPTLRWKGGNKSRSFAAIKMPRACLATNVKTLNCDDCSIVSAYSSEEDEIFTEGEKLPEDAKHPHRYHIYRPKPSSTLLTTFLTSSTHQSAFVRLVAQMKTLVNIQHTAKEQTHSPTTKKIDHYKMRKEARRGHPSKTAVSLKMSQLPKSPLNLPLTQIFLRSRKESCVQKSFKLPSNLITKKGNSDGDTKASSKPGKAVKVKKITTVPLQASTKRDKRNATQSKIINIVAFAQKGSTENTNKNIIPTKSNESSNIAPSREIRHKQRKRKSIDLSSSTNKVHGSEMIEKKVYLTEQDVMPPLRKSARLSKDGTNDLLSGTVNRITVKKIKLRGMNKRLSDSFSPPMTRSRLKELMQQHPIMSESNNSIQ